MAIIKAPSTNEEWREFVLSFIASLTLCDHMGDVCDDVDTVLEVLDFKAEWDDMGDLMTVLGRAGVKTLVGTDLSE